MGRITSNVGLITGINVTETVDALLKLASQPRNLLTVRTQDLQRQQLAINTLATQLVTVQFDVGKLKTSSLYSAKRVESSDTTKLIATIASGGTPVSANYQFSPIRTAGAQHQISQRFESPGAALSESSFSFRTGGFVDKGISLDDLNAGQGVRRGQFRITDKSGDSAVIDLRYAVTIDDVLEAISTNADVNVAAEAVGDALRITDNTGQSGTLTIQEVNNSHTAEDLGIAGISLAGATTVGTGDDIFSLSTGTRLSFLNDGTGVRVTDGTTNAEDLVITLADGTVAEVDLSGVTTVGGVLEAINEHEDLAGKITAALSADGNRLQLTDLTTGSETFSVENGLLGSAAEDLGLTGAAVGNLITGDRLVSGLADTLLSSVNGGKGVTTLGTLDVTNGDGVLSQIDLSGAETLGDVIDLINAGASGVTATLNANRSGIVLTDTTGGTTSNFIVADNGSSTVAADLGIAVDEATATVDSGSLDRHTLGAGTLLSRVNGGRGITTLGDITITGTTGAKKTLDLNKKDAEVKTVGDVIDAINAAAVGVVATINASGDGIVVTDTAGGPGKITIQDAGGSLAAELGLAGTSVEVDIASTPTEVLDGTSRGLVAIEAGDTLAEVAAAINALDKGVTAAVIYDGQGYRLSLTADRTGAANELLIDLGDSVFEFQEISRAQDAILQFGDAQASAGGILVTSASNSFNQVVAGLNLAVVSADGTPVTVTVSDNDESFISAVEDFVKSFNVVRGALDELTDFNPDDLTTGLLFATNEALRVDTDLGRTVTDRYFGLGTYQSLEQLGISVEEDGTLVLDDDKLKAAFAADPQGLEDFFAKEDVGFVAKFDAMVERLAGAENGALGNRYDSLQDTVDSNQLRLDRYEESLARQRELLLFQFAQMESVIANLQANLSALSSFTALPPLSVTRNS